MSQFRNLNQMCFEEFLFKCHQEVVNSRIKFSDIPLDLGSPSLASLNDILPYLSFEGGQRPSSNLARFLLLRCEALIQESYEDPQISLDILRDARMALRSGHLKGSECWRALGLILRYSNLIPPETRSGFRSSWENIEIVYTMEKGRSVFAKRDLKIGSLVSSERPLVAFIHSKNAHYTFCTHCFRTTFNPLPCSECNHSVFCSLECLNTSQSHHYYECQMGLDGIIEKLCPRTSMPLGKILILRLITQKNYHFFRSRYSPEDIDTTQVPALRALDLKDAYDRLWHKIRIFASEEDKKKLSFMDAFFYLLKKTTDYFNDALPSDYENVYTIMTHYESIVDGNSFTLEEFHAKKQVLGSSLYDISSFYNHSCDPNACFVFDSDKRLNVIITSPVRKGEEIFISYGPLVWNQNYEERRVKLQNYNFICSCSACREQLSPGEERTPHFQLGELREQPRELLERISRGELNEVHSKSKLKNIVHLCSWFLYGQ